MAERKFKEFADPKNLGQLLFELKKTDDPDIYLKIQAFLTALFGMKLEDVLVAWDLFTVYDSLVAADDPLKTQVQKIGDAIQHRMAQVCQTNGFRVLPYAIGKSKTDDFFKKLVKGGPMF
jgi:hypothetical protein